MYGDFLDRDACHRKKRLEDDRKILPVDVSYLWYGSLYRTGFQKAWEVPVFVRGSIYMLGIFAAEYSSGMLLKKYHLCPWDYSQVPYNYKGVIRLDYAPVWFFTGLLYEKILSKKR